MEEEENLPLAVENYRQQIKKVKGALKHVTSESDRAELLELKGNLEELLKLTLDSLKSKVETPENTEVNSSVDPSENTECNSSVDPLAEEYELFKAELGIDLEEKKVGFENETSDTGRTNENNHKAQHELESLIGKKCQAPYANNYGMMEFHNALVVGIEAGDLISHLNQIKVRVLFTNPTERSMVPCPYFLDDKCKFGEDSCNFSHGYLTSFDNLREYQEPDFSKLSKGSRVLARVGTSKLWKSSVIEDIPSDEQVVVKHEGNFTPVLVHDILPLVGMDDDTSPSSCSDDEQWLKSRQEEMVEKSLNAEPMLQKLGDWEQFTKGIGSKLMAKMGYVVGTGLGKNGEGRLEPVEALVLPVGKSLDHCMNLKEAAGGSTDLFSVEKRQKKLALRELRKSERTYQREKKKKKHDLFNFINSNLFSEDCKPSSSSAKIRSNESLKKKLASTSGRELNVQCLKIAQDVRDAERQIFILSESLGRQKSGSILHKNLLSRLHSEHEKLSELKNFEKKVEQEQNLRETKKKMTVF